MNPTQTNPKLWAAEVLGVAPDVTPAEARRAFLDRLAQSDFLPPPAWRYAAKLLAKDNRAANEVIPVEAPWLAAEEERLREAVDNFAAIYFDLDPQERRLRWEKLRDESSWFLPLAARLRALESGLALTKPPGESDPLAAQLIEHICSLYTLWPAERACKRQEHLEQIASAGASEQQPSAWQAAAQRLRKNHPAIAELEPVLIYRLVNWKKLRRVAREPRQARPAPPKPAPTQGGNKGWPIWVVVVLVIATLRFCAGTTNRSTPPSPERSRMPVLPTQPYEPSPDMEQLMKQYRERGSAPVWPGRRPLLEKEAEPKEPPLTPEQESLRQYRRSRGATGPVDPARQPEAPVPPVSGSGGPVSK